MRNLQRVLYTTAAVGALVISAAVPAAAAPTWSVVASQSSGTQSILTSVDLLSAAAGWAAVLRPRAA
jgi:hypothetical protein